MNPTIQLLHFLLLSNFPSGSSICYHDKKLYLVGDDARRFLVLDTHYKVVDSIGLFDFPEKRIPKAQKADFESSCFIKLNGVNHLLVIGSASSEARKKVLVIPFSPSAFIQPVRPHLFYNINEFIARLTLAGIDDVNIEGAAVTDNYFLLSSRGNRTHPNNCLLITDKDFWVHQKEATLTILPVVLPQGPPEFLGVSELSYVQSNDMLLLTLSSEATGNSYDDGAIGDSYIGWVNNIKSKIHESELRLDGLINLPAISTEFNGQKIEGICVETDRGDELVLHLISDNDRGESKLFKVCMKFNR